AGRGPMSGVKGLDRVDHFHSSSALGSGCSIAPGLDHDLRREASAGNTQDPRETTYWGIDLGRRTGEGHRGRVVESSGATRRSRRRSFGPRHGMEFKSQKSAKWIL